MRTWHRRHAAALLVLAAVSTAQAPPQPVVRITTSARALQPGEVVEFTFTTVRPFEDVRLTMFDRAWPVIRLEAGLWKALVGIDLDTVPRTYAAVVTVGAEGAPASHVTRRLAVAAKAFGTRRLTVDEAFVTPPAELQARIAGEAARLAEIWQRAPTPRAWTDAFAPPVPQAANSAFGKRSVFNGQVRGAHTGADFPSPSGEPVRAPNAGRVVLAEELYYSGNTVILDHGLGLFSTFAHLATMAVKTGDEVAPGNSIGLVGATGRVTGPHLHWAVRLNGSRVDPLSLIWVTARRKP